MSQKYSLSQLGWQAFFQQQLNLEEWESCHPARVIDQQRSMLTVLAADGKYRVPITATMPLLVVGDWLLLDEKQQFYRALDRISVFTRKAPGTKVAEQVIATNVDTVFILCSLNHDFNLNRIERYLALVNAAGVEAVVVLSKADCCNDTENLMQQVQKLDSLLAVVAINALDVDSVGALQPWLREGKTIAMLGSSGVGKSTLTNTLMGNEAQLTKGIREDDSKGRHTTTGRSLHLMPGGCLLMDTPGMRELQLSDCEQGIKSTFSQIDELATQCQFSDCQHDTEPGCAVQAALASGELDERRLSNYQKLLREQAFNSATLAEKRSRERSLTRHYRTVLGNVEKRKKRR